MITSCVEVVMSDHLLTMTKKTEQYQNKQPSQDLPTLSRLIKQVWGFFQHFSSKKNLLYY